MVKPVADMNTPTFTVTLRAEKDWTPEPAIRLRRLLKHAGRYLGLKCIDVAEVKPTPPATKTGQEA